MSGFDFPVAGSDAARVLALAAHGAFIAPAEPFGGRGVHRFDAALRELRSLGFTFSCVRGGDKVVADDRWIFQTAEGIDWLAAARDAHNSGRQDGAPTNHRDK